MIQIPFFRGKPLKALDDEFIESLGENYKDGYVYGDINRDGKDILIVGEILEWNNEYVIHEYWVQVDPESVELAEYGQHVGKGEGVRSNDD